MSHPDRSASPPSAGLFATAAYAGFAALLGLTVVGLVRDVSGREEVVPAVRVAATPGVDDEDDTEILFDEEGHPAHGRWRVVRDAMRMTEAQREEAAALEAIGYTDGELEITRDPTVVPIYDAARSQGGVNLYNAGHAAEATLVDMDGNTLFTWRTTYGDVFGRDGNPNRGSEHHPRRVRLGEQGEVYWVFEGRGIARTNLDGTVAWGVLSGAHHDVRLAPNGEIAVLERESGLHEGVNKDKPILLDEISFRDRETGEERRAVSLVDALLDGGFLRILRKRRGDVLHTNSLQRITPELAAAVDHPAFVAGHYLVSMRNPSAVGIVDPDKGVFTWVKRGVFDQQHEAVLTATPELLMFDNRGGGKARSRVRVFDVPGMREVWSWGGPSDDDPLWSNILSTVQPLDNGNVLVVEGLGGRAFEVTRPEGDVVWQFHSPHRAGPDGRYIASLFDVVRFSRDDPRIVAVLGPAE